MSTRKAAFLKVSGKDALPVKMESPDRVTPRHVSQHQPLRHAVQPQTRHMMKPIMTLLTGITQLTAKIITPCHVAMKITNAA